MLRNRRRHDPLARQPQAINGKWELEPEPPPKPKREVYHREPRMTKADRANEAYWANRACPPEPEETWFRHTHWQYKRTLVAKALAAAGTSARSLEAFDYCGAQCVVEYCEAEKKYRVRADYCRNRHCEPCMRAKANLLAANLRTRLEQRPQGRYRFVTLPLKHTDAPLVDQIRRLYTSFSALRKTPMWKTNVIGGAATFEVKWGKPKGADRDAKAEWHPHLHVIIEGDYIDKRRLGEEWHRITGDSFIVDIRQLDSSKDAAHYVAKYVGKGCNGEVWHDEQARIEFVVAMRGVRTAGTFGKWRGFKLLGHDPDPRQWNRVASLRSIVQAARDGEAWAQAAMKCLLDDVQYNPHKPRKRKHEGDAPPPD